jgi:hypothetical protein
MIAPSTGRQERICASPETAATLLALFAPGIFLVYSLFYSLPQNGGTIILQAIEGVQAASTDANTGTRVTGTKRGLKLTPSLTTQLWRPQKIARRRIVALIAEPQSDNHR